MSDLIESLRALARYVHDDMTVASDAADEIERLRDQNAELLEALKQIADRAVPVQKEEHRMARIAIAKTKGGL